MISSVPRPIFKYADPDAINMYEFAKRSKGTSERINTHLYVLFHYLLMHVQFHTTCTFYSLPVFRL